MTDAVRAQYPPIEEYAFLSDGHTSALVGLDGGVEWMCVPRFDGPSVFARMLDRTRGGAFTVDVAGASLPERRYLDGSLVLESRFVAPDATVMILDFLALAEEGPHGRGEVDPHHVLVRIVRCERGTARIRTTIDPRPDYARSTAQWRSSAGMFSAAAPGTRLWATSDRTLAVDGNGALSADFDLAAGEAAAFSLRYLGDPVQRIGPSAAQRLLETTLGSWRTWSSRCAYQGPLLELVERSAVVLKGLVYHHSGAVLAAPTTSLPESIGGERNW
ncbi:MAG: glycoside hydrolase family 15 protein, partial [Gemmatimonadaceae bacterium]|nr:glycoside hydrolase family 15 protein [Gemmatimonadaceae bacterium]